MTQPRTYTLDTGEIIRARTHAEAHAALCRRLRVSGPRALEATSEDGAVVYASLYDGEDYILASNGRRVL